MKVTTNLLGTDKLLRKFEAYGVESVKVFKQITKVAAEEIKEKAKQKTPVDTGKLRQSIYNQNLKNIAQRIYVAEPYAAYVEFGTGGLVDVPNGWESIALRFKGKGIKQINLPARPYLYPAFKEGSKQYVKDLEYGITKLSKKYNKK